MAIVFLPLMSGYASGKFGNVVFFRRYGKSIARMRVKPRNPKTFKQQLLRSNLGALSSAFVGDGRYVLVDEDGSKTGKSGTKYVVLKRYDAITQQTYEVYFPVLTDEEKMKWEEYTVKELNKPKQFARVVFIGMNVRRLYANVNPIRNPYEGSYISSGGSGGGSGEAVA